MTQDEWRHRNHQYLADFLKETENERGEDANISAFIKIIMAQFVSTVRLSLWQKSSAGKEEYISHEDLMHCNIAALRQCIVDLQVLLNPELSH